MIVKSGARLLKFVLKSIFTSVRFCLIKKTIVDFEVRLAHGSSEKFIVGIKLDNSKKWFKVKGY